MQRQARRKTKHLLEEEPVVDQVCGKIDERLHRISNWPIERTGFCVISPGLKRVFKRGRKGYRNSKEHPTAENLHEWRKRVKYLWYHFRILQPIWSRVIKAWARSCHDLSDVLGDIHDLAELTKSLVHTPTASHEERQALLGLIDRRRRGLQQTAFRLGARIYTEKPSEFVQRIRTYYEVWRREPGPGDFPDPLP